MVFLLLYIEGAATKIGCGNLRMPVDEPEGGLQRIKHSSPLAGDKGGAYLKILEAFILDEMMSQTYL